MTLQLIQKSLKHSDKKAITIIPVQLSDITITEIRIANLFPNPGKYNLLLVPVNEDPDYKHYLIKDRVISSNDNQVVTLDLLVPAGTRLMGSCVNSLYVSDEDIAAFSIFINTEVEEDNILIDYMFITTREWNYSSTIKAAEADTNISANDIRRILDIAIRTNKPILYHGILFGSTDQRNHTCQFSDDYIKASHNFEIECCGDSYVIRDDF